ncbi:hypothetical protein ANN_09133 [Periplaneta americana]|uniref:Uncharacterized protein n=1 Tax=Periplaneta americana TaxID=6978 RepID=A0ABQ8TKW0_PERAM|nr:hypothetical protein ANN_09133 [Periplaneta americana]
MPCPSQTSGFYVPNYVRLEHIKTLERIQKRALKCCRNNSSLRWDTLTDRRTRIRLCALFITYRAARSWGPLVLDRIRTRSCECTPDTPFRCLGKRPVRRSCNNDAETSWGAAWGRPAHLQISMSSSVGHSASPMLLTPASRRKSDIDLIFMLPMGSTSPCGYSRPWLH